jgi:hypothetical protein
VYQVILFTIFTIIILMIFKNIRMFLYYLFGINMVLNQNVENFKSKFKYNYLKTMGFSILYGYLLIILGIFYQYILLNIGNLTQLLIILFIVPIFSRICVYIGIKLYKKDS